MPSSSPLPLFAQAEDWFHRAHAALLHTLPCRKGCAHCCIGPFPITILDVAELRRGLKTLPSSRRDTITERAARQVALIEAEYPQLAADPALDRWPDHTTDELVARFSDLPCPALQEDGSCAVYPFRPVTCRTMGIPVETDGLIAGACEVQIAVPIVRLPEAIRREEDRLAENEAHAIDALRHHGEDVREEILLPYGFLAEDIESSWTASEKL